MDKKALVSIVYGDTYLSSWSKYCEKSWKEYASKYNYDIVIFNEPLDNSELARSRSVAWQKCLVLNTPQLINYDRVLWLDSDIIINNAIAPDIVKDVPLNKIGVTNEFSFYTEENYAFLFEGYIRYWLKENPNAVINPTPNAFYTSFGLNTTLNEVVQTGVMVLNPKYHNDILKHVYYNYEDKGGSSWNYEMRPLSYEIVKSDFHYFINNRFNLLYNNFKYLYYKHLVDSKPDVFSKPSIYHNVLNKLTRRANFTMQEKLAVQNAFSNAYFLHFAGCQEDIKYSDGL